MPKNIGIFNSGTVCICGSSRSMVNAFKHSRHNSDTKRHILTTGSDKTQAYFCMRFDLVSKERGAPG